MKVALAVVVLLGTVGPGADIICGTLFESFLIESILQAFSVEIFMPLGLALQFAIETTYTGMSQGSYA